MQLARVDAKWFDPQLPQRVAEAMAQHPYVSRVAFVARDLAPPADRIAGTEEPRFTRRLLINVELRKPLAQISNQRAGSPRTCVLDASGYVLEERRLADPDLPQVTRFENSLPRLDPGKQVLSPDIRAGLDLLARLSAYSDSFYGDVREVDVANYNRRQPLNSELVVRAGPVGTDALQEIQWGLRLGSPDASAESNSTDRKLLILDNIYRQYRTLNLRRGPYNLFLRPNTAYWRETTEPPALPPVGRGV